MVQELLDQDSRLLSTFHLQERLIGVVGRVVCFLLLQIAMELSAKKYKFMDNHYCLSNMTQYVLISLKCQNSEHSKKYQISRRVEQINKWAIYNRPVFYMGPEHFISLGLQLATDQVDLWGENL